MWPETPPDPSLAMASAGQKGATPVPPLPVRMFHGYEHPASLAASLRYSEERLVDDEPLTRTTTVMSWPAGTVKPGFSAKISGWSQAIEAHVCLFFQKDGDETRGGINPLGQH